MGTVTDVTWKCPGCDTINIAQLSDWHHGDNYDNPKPLPSEALPSNAELKWNPPCDKCGDYRLVEPPVTLVRFPVERVEKEYEYYDDEEY